MPEEILTWPDPVTADNLVDINLDKLFTLEPLISNRETLQQFRFLSSIHRAITNISDKDLKIAGIISQLPDLKSNWAEILNGVRRAAQQDPGNLGAGTFSQNGNQYKFTVNYASASGSKELVGDPNLNQSPDLQKDLGRLFDIGQDIESYELATKGGLRSPLTRASLKAITDEAEKAKEQLTSHAATEAQNISAEVNAAIAIRGWSQYYKKRCDELNKLINGTKKEKMRRLRKIKKEYRDGGLLVDRLRWQKWLMISLGLYAAFALIIITNPIHADYNGALSSGFSKYFLGLTLYGLLGGVFIAYSYANKQLKVHQNLYEQYRHRAVVAETIEGIIAAVIKTKNGTLPAGETPSVIEQSQLETLVRVAATAMFENRPIGHLSTKEATGGLLGEVLGRNS